MPAFLFLLSMNNSIAFQRFQDRVIKEQESVYILNESSKIYEQKFYTENDDKRSLYTSKSKVNKATYVNVYSYFIHYIEDVVDFLLRDCMKTINVGEIIKLVDVDKIQLTSKAVLRILKKESIDDIIKSQLVLQIKEKLENKKGYSLLDKFLKVFNIGVDLREIKVYFQMRHLFIHNLDYPDNTFEHTFLSYVGCKNKKSEEFIEKYSYFLQTSGKLPTDYKKLKRALIVYIEITKEIDSQILKFVKKQTPTEAGV